MSDPVHGVGYTFGIDIDGNLSKEVVAVSGLSWEQEMVEVKTNTGDGKYVYRLIEGLPKYGDLTITFPLVQGNKLNDWKKSTLTSVVPKNVSVIIYNAQGSKIVTAHLSGAKIKKWEVDGELKAGGNAALNEKVTMGYTGIEWE
jgi:phage tail-like protein